MLLKIETLATTLQQYQNLTFEDALCIPIKKVSDDILAVYSDCNTR